MNKQGNNARTLAAIGGAIGLPVGMDVLQHDDFSLESFDKKRIGNAILNAMIGAGAGHIGGSGRAGDIVHATGLAALAPTKDLVLNLQDTPGKLNETMDQMSTANKVLAGLGIGALGLGAIGVGKYLMQKDPKTDMGSIKLKLPGKKDEPGTDAEVILPIDMPQMSPSLLEGLNRGVRVQARKNVRANSMKRDPETGKNIPIEEWEEKYKNTMYDPEFLGKEASTREWAEGAGQILTGLTGATIGSTIGSRMSSPENSLMGSLSGAVVGGLGPILLGRLIANVMNNRTDTEQYIHDRHTPLAEYLVPGYAAYQNERRVTQVEDPDKYKNKLSFANTLASDASFDSYDTGAYDSYDPYTYKYASAAPAPPPPASGEPMPPPPGPAPLPPAHKNIPRPVEGTIPPSAEARYNSTGHGSAADKVRQAAQSLRNALSINKTASELPYTVELYKKASVKDMSAREEARGIMKKIYDEDPSYWPYGLDIPGHESLYIIRDNMTKAAAGFVGWQEMVENGKRVGSYSIGILPEYRNKGFAKEAVAKVLRIKSAAVDEVRAYVMKHNAPSHALADSLGVKVQESF